MTEFIEFSEAVMPSVSTSYEKSHEVIKGDPRIDGPYLDDIRAAQEEEYRNRRNNAANEVSEEDDSAEEEASESEEEDDSKEKENQ